MRRALQIVMPVGAALMVASCGSSSSSAPASPPAGAQTVTVKLSHVPVGQATLSYDATAKVLTVDVRLTGLAPSSGHPNHIHTGSCERQGGVEYPLTALIADAHGVAAATTKITSVKEGRIPDGAWYVNVHNGPSLSPDDQLLPIVCGNVTNPSGGSSVIVPLTEGPPPPSTPGSPDEHASGTATLSVTGGSLTVTLDVTGLAPNSSHAAHIHLGSCESQGDVVHPLDILHADASGAAHETKTFPSVTAIPSGRWYVNVHHAADLSTQTGFDPIVCGDVG